MQIQSISSRSVNFQGLWGDTVTKKSMKDEFRVYDYYKTYHPFIDEQSKDIQNIQRINTCAYKHNGNYAQDKYISNSMCYIKERLPITASEWKLYEKDKFLLDKKALKRIESSLKEFNLTKYIK